MGRNRAYGKKFLCQKLKNTEGETIIKMSPFNGDSLLIGLK